MNTYCIALDYSNPAGDPVRMDASDYRASMAGKTPEHVSVRFISMNGDSHANSSASVVSYPEEDCYLVTMFERVDGKFVLSCERCQKLSTALRVAHGWCIAD